MNCHQDSFWRALLVFILFCAAYFSNFWFIVAVECTLNVSYSIESHHIGSSVVYVWLTHIDRSKNISNNTLHLMYCIAMRPNNNTTDDVWLQILANNACQPQAHCAWVLNKTKVCQVFATFLPVKSTWLAQHFAVLFCWVLCSILCDIFAKEVVNNSSVFCSVLSAEHVSEIEPKQGDRILGFVTSVRYMICCCQLILYIHTPI